MYFCAVENKELELDIYIKALYMYMYLYMNYNIISCVQQPFTAQRKHRVQKDCFSAFN